MHQHVLLCDLVGGRGPAPLLCRLKGALQTYDDEEEEEDEMRRSEVHALLLFGVWGVGRCLRCYATSPGVSAWLSTNIT
jgi:hypothetical protein